MAGLGREFTPVAVYPLWPSVASKGHQLWQPSNRKTTIAVTMVAELSTYCMHNRPSHLSETETAASTLQTGKLRLAGVRFFQGHKAGLGVTQK
jgi:hypothetical protein